MVGHGSPMYHLPGNVINATVVLIYINLQTEYEFPSSTRFEQFRKFGKMELGRHRFRQPLLRKNFCTWSEFLFVATCASDLTFLALLTSEI